LLYVSNLPKITNSKSKTVPFVDDTSIIVNNPKQLALKNEMNKVFNDISESFKANLLSLTTDGTYFMQFSTKNYSLTELNITITK
jgi:hypothetical protein